MRWVHQRKDRRQRRQLAVLPETIVFRRKQPSRDPTPNMVTRLNQNSQDRVSLSAPWSPPATA